MFTGAEEFSTPETEKEMCIVQVQSAGFNGGNFAKITLNGELINIEEKIDND